MKKISPNKQIIIGNNLKADAVVPLNMTYEGGSYILVNESEFSKAEAAHIKQHYRDVCIKHEINENIIKSKEGVKVIRRIVRKDKVMSKKDNRIRIEVYAMMRSRDDFRYTTELLKLFNDTFKNKFCKETTITKTYEINHTSYIRGKIKKNKLKPIFQYQALSINESLKTFLISSPLEKWYAKWEQLQSQLPTTHREINEYRRKLYEINKSKELAIEELETFFKKDNENAMDWDEYATAEVKRLLEVTNDYQVPVPKMQK